MTSKTGASTKEGVMSTATQVQKHKRIEGITLDPGDPTGLCGTCIHAQLCGYRLRNPNSAVWHCEEFDCRAEPQAHASDDESELRESLRWGGAAEKAMQARYTGLCKNCRHRETCRIRKDSVTVWHCEEYE
jgi:hypothetical protein